MQRGLGRNGGPPSLTTYTPPSISTWKYGFRFSALPTRVFIEIQRPDIAGEITEDQPCEDDETVADGIADAGVISRDRVLARGFELDPSLSLDAAGD